MIENIAVIASFTNTREERGNFMFVPPCGARKFRKSQNVTLGSDLRGSDPCKRCLSQHSVPNYLTPTHPVPLGAVRLLRRSVGLKYDFVLSVGACCLKHFDFSHKRWSHAAHVYFKIIIIFGQFFT